MYCGSPPLLVTVPGSGACVHTLPPRPNLYWLAPSEVVGTNVAQLVYKSPDPGSCVNNSFHYLKKSAGSHDFIVKWSRDLQPARKWGKNKIKRRAVMGVLLLSETS
jgi:hypothetical protein